MNNEKEEMCWLGIIPFSAWSWYKITDLNSGDCILHHLIGHVVHIVVPSVVHGGIEKHQHYVTLELCRCSDQTTLYVALDFLEIHCSGKYIGISLPSCILILAHFERHIRYYIFLNWQKYTGFFI